MATDPAVQAAQAYLHNVFCGTPACALDCLADARSVVAAAAPLIRAQAFTEAANAVEIRVAISDPGRYTPRKRAGYQPDESLAQWQARAVGIVIRGLSEGTENA